jgi:hypothetical protein
MTTKHTPSPWNCYTKGSDIYVEDAKENGIANIRRNFDLHFNEKMANAYLIAAAPELLEILVRSGDNSEAIDANNTQEARVMRLKGYGNAIVPQAASSFIQAFMAAQ